LTARKSGDVVSAPPQIKIDCQNSWCAEGTGRYVCTISISLVKRAIGNALLPTFQAFPGVLSPDITREGLSKAAEKTRASMAQCNGMME